MGSLYRIGLFPKAARSEPTAEYELPDFRLGDDYSFKAMIKPKRLLIVDDEHHLLGIFTDGDLRRALYKNGPDVLSIPLEKLYQKNPKVITDDKLAWNAMQLMEHDQRNPFMVLPVVDSKKVLKGLIKMHDVVQSGL